MTRSTIIVCMLACLWLAACSGTTPTDPGAQAGTAAVPQPTQGGSMEAEQNQRTAPDATASTTAVGDLEPALKAGMAYADFRTLVTGRGWEPVPDAQCRVNVVGANHAELCAANPELATCKACDALPELSACSADGHCVMNFRHAGARQALRAVSYGMLADHGVSGDDSRLELSSWEFTPLTD